ncbi:MAG TPA: LysR family transcriptional regulator [Candidatus Acidoferrum sp.]|nr:LysR family transcriptional regulator [Candidatus Acidoferrum sp.]
MPTSLGLTERLMELMQLEMFVAVVEEGSVRRASERVFRTQPAVSIGVRKLEGEFGAPLFDRSKRNSFRLTQAGESLYRYARKMLSLRNEAASELEEIAKLRAGRLAIGANESGCLYVVPRLTQAYLKKYPGVRLELKCERSEDLLASLKARRLDVALVSFRPNDPELESAFLMEDELVLIAAATSPLGRRGRAEFRDLAVEPVLMMDISQPSPWHKRVADEFVRNKIALHLQVENAPIETIKKMVTLGLGVGFVPLLCVTDEVQRGELTTVEVGGFREIRSVWLVRRWAQQSAMAQAFMEVASELEAGFAMSSAVVQQKTKANKVVAVNRRA